MTKSSLLSSYVHTQSTESSVWTIDHNLGTTPNVSVTVEYEGKMQPIIPASIEYPSMNQVVITFESRPFKGSARLI